LNEATQMSFDFFKVKKLNKLNQCQAYFRTNMGFKVPLLYKNGKNVFESDEF